MAAAGDYHEKAGVVKWFLRRTLELFLRSDSPLVSFRDDVVEEFGPPRFHPHSW